MACAEGHRLESSDDVCYEEGVYKQFSYECVPCDADDASCQGNITVADEVRDIVRQQAGWGGGARGEGVCSFSAVVSSFVLLSHPVAGRRGLVRTMSPILHLKRGVFCGRLVH